MLQNIPFYSDLAKVSAQTIDNWEAHYARLLRYNQYFTGEIFDEKVKLESQADDEAPLLYPVGLNLVRMLALSQADAVYGNWPDEIFKFGVRGDEEVTDVDDKAIKLASDILLGSNAASMAWEIEVDRNVYGGGVFKIIPNLIKPGHIQWIRLRPGSFYPIYDPDDPERILEAYVIIEMTKDQAKAKYGIQTERDTVFRVEHWTEEIYENMIDGVKVNTYSGINPWKIVPFVYIPRMRTTNWYGDALTEEIMEPQDEMNMRVADMGEAINYNAHPIRWGRNLPRAFNAKNFPIGSDNLWDLGKAIGNSPPPEVGLLEIKNPISQGAFEHVKFLYDWVRTSSSSPPIAFGDDDGGGQRSGTTLEIRMWPLVRAIKRSRSYLSAGWTRALWISAIILKQKGLRKDALDPILEGRVIPQFSDILPRDHAQVVDEVVKLMSLQPPEISMEGAQKLLGRGPGETNRILKMIKDPALSDFFKPVQQQFAEQSNNANNEAKKKKKEAEKPQV